jgi:hypothetical protein
MDLQFVVVAEYADAVNLLGGSVHTIKENAEALVVASKEIGLDVNADKTKYMVMSPDQHAERSHSMKIDNTGLRLRNIFEKFSSSSCIFMC